MQSEPWGRIVPPGLLPRKSVMGSGSGTVLNPYQERHLRVSLHEADRLLSEIAQILNSAASKSPFPKFVVDLTPAQRKTIEDYIDRVRARLVRVLESQNIEPEPPSIPATRAIHSALTFIDIAVEELRPRYMRGYGEVPPEAAAELNGIVGELSALVQQLDRYVTQGGHDLKERLAQLERAGSDVEVLSELERIISEHGLVEFRSTLAMILNRLEDSSFEIAVFGRVSSGKSSLLNAVLETDILPVGVTPITAVPARIIYGEAPAVMVWFPDRAPEQYDIRRLGEFASEQQTSGNGKHVSRIVVQLPSVWLKDGVAFVDTPGLGSLATSGAAETMAYLPRCDLGVVLIDAGATLSTNDLQTIDALHHAGIPAQVLLSKADLLAPQDLEHVVSYTSEHLKTEIGVDFAVQPVSVIGTHRERLNQWFEQEIAPLFDHRQELRAASVRRKIGTLHEAVELALRSRVQRSEQPRSGVLSDIRTVDADLRAATAWIEEAEAAAKRFADSISAESQTILVHSAERLLTLWANDKDAVDSAAEVRQAALEHVQARANILQQTLDSLASQLVKQLESTARVVGTPNRPTEGEFREFVREMPVLDLGGLRLSASRPLLGGLFGKQFEVQQVARELGRKAGPQLGDALTAYSRVLRDWCGSVLGQMQRRFAAYADGYRAQAERAASGAEVSGEERRAIERELELLAALSPVAPGPEAVQQAS
jgi:GTP-binding protein EngB required for normal cell division